MSANAMVSDSRKNEIENDYKGSTVITSIFRSIEQGDTLIELLIQKYKEAEKEQHNLDAEQSSNAPGESKGAKYDVVVIEDIKAVNNQLRNLITELLGVVEAKDNKVLTLKERLTELEEEYTNIKRGTNTEISSSTSSAGSHTKADNDA